MEAEKQKIRKEFERKESLVDVKKKMCAARRNRKLAGRRVAVHTLAAWLARAPCTRLQARKAAGRVSARAAWRGTSQLVCKP